MLIHAAPSHLLPPPPPLHFLAIQTSSVCRRTGASRNPPLIELRRRTGFGLCRARRRVRYDDDEDEDEEYGQNEEITMLESYSDLARSEALLVRATVDGQEEVVLIFKGFSSCLSAWTASDPSRSVLPAKAVIYNIDVIRGPFDPNNIEFLEEGLTLEVIKARLQQNNV